VTDVIDSAELGYFLVQAKELFFVPRNLPNVIALVLRDKVASPTYDEQLACLSMEADGHASQRKHNAAPEADKKKSEATDEDRWNYV